MGVELIRQAIGPYFPMYLPFEQTNLADANGDCEVLGGGNIDYGPMPFGGSIVMSNIRTNADLTGGEITFKPSLDGTAVTSAALNLVLGDTAQSDYANCAPEVITFTAGQRIGLNYTKTGTVAPATTDLIAGLWILMNHGNN